MPDFKLGSIFLNPLKNIISLFYGGLGVYRSIMEIKYKNFFKGGDKKLSLFHKF